MSIVKIKDKTFETSISEADIKARIKEVSARINEDLTGRHIIVVEDFVDTGRSLKEIYTLVK